MSRHEAAEILDAEAENVGRTGFFCRMSKKKSDGYLVIHGLWGVGRSKGKGFSAVLRDSCIADARRQNGRGVAVVVSEQAWMAGRRVFDQQGFACVDTAPPAGALLVKRFAGRPLPLLGGAR